MKCHDAVTAKQQRDLSGIKNGKRINYIGYQFVVCFWCVGEGGWPPSVAFPTKANMISGFILRTDTYLINVLFYDYVW